MREIYRNILNLFSMRKQEKVKQNSPYIVFNLIALHNPCLYLYLYFICLFIYLRFCIRSKHSTKINY